MEVLYIIHIVVRCLFFASPSQLFTSFILAVSIYCYSSDLQNRFSFNLILFEFNSFPPFSRILKWGNFIKDISWLLPKLFSYFFKFCRTKKPVRNLNPNLIEQNYSPIQQLIFGEFDFQIYSDFSSNRFFTHFFNRIYLKWKWIAQKSSRFARYISCRISNTCLPRFKDAF